MAENEKKPSGASLLGRADTSITSRIAVLLCICGVIAVALVGRLAYLQIIKNEYYRTKVIDQIVYETSVKASRGAIYDRNGILLAGNHTTERIFISPCDIASDGQREILCRGLSEILSVDYDALYEKSQKTYRKDETVKSAVDEHTADRVREFALANDLNNVIHFAAMSSRIYPYSTLASAVIGFAGTDRGLYGLEYEYNDILSGISGKIVTAQNVSGNEMPYSYETYIDAKNGANLMTSIDEVIQSTLEKYLQIAAEEAGCQSRATTIAMNPSTGEIYGMAVYPSYDLNDPYTLADYYTDALQAVADEYGEDSDEYAQKKRAMQLEMWNNKAITETYEPGSTSKIFTTSIAIEEGLAKIDELFTCTGSYTVSGWKIKCHKTTGHGTLTFAQALQKSCNPVMMRLSQRIGISTYYKYFRGFGLDKVTGIDLPGEAKAVVKSESDMKELDLAVYSFGQRYNVTALSQLRAVCAVANGGTLVTPHIVNSIVDDDGNTLYEFADGDMRQVISESTAETISQILADGVSGDGGAKNAYVAGYSVAAKTGTSEKGTVGNKRIVSTVAYAPSDDAKIALIMVIDEPTRGLIYGSQLVAPYISKILSEVLPYLGVEAEYTEKDHQALTTSLPNFRGMSTDEAQSRLKDIGIKYELIGNGTSVISQVPISGSAVSKADGKVILYTENAEPQLTAIVPDVTGKTAETANKILTDAGFNIGIYGRTNGTTVFTQSSKAGTEEKIGTVINITLTDSTVLE